MSRLVVASNRGPVQFEYAGSGDSVSNRGGGGLAMTLSRALADEELTWVSAAMSDADRSVALAEHGTPEVALGSGLARVHMLDLPREEFHNYYDGISNRLLYLLQVRLLDFARTPEYDEQFWRAWQSYVDVNREFALACDVELSTDGELFVNDYHLMLVPEMLRRRNRHDVGVMHFTHSPWVDPDYFSILPTAVAHELLGGVLGSDLIGFSSDRWCRNFLLCCDQFGYEVDWAHRTVRSGDRRVPVRSYPIGVDEDEIRREANDPSVQERYGALVDTYRDRRLITRVERMDPVKNLLRGLRGYEAFLERHPEQVARVMHFAMAYETRSGDEYRAYRDDVTEVAGRINRRFQRDGLAPLELRLHPDYQLSLAAMRRADVLLVNSLADGMNLVAKEGVLLGERDPVLILTPTAGAADQLRDAALMVNPFDTAELTKALARAVTMHPDERAERARSLRQAAREFPPQEWFRTQRRELQHRGDAGAAEAV